MLLAQSLRFLDAFGNKAPDWVSHWLTPLWILGLGALAGLLLCLLVWLIAFALSRIPALGELQQQPQARRIAVAVLTVAYLALFAWLAFSPPPGAPAGAAPGQGNAPALAILPLLLGALLAAAGTVAIISRRAVSGAWDTVREGALWPAFIILAVWAGFGILGIVVVRNPSQIAESIVRLPALVQAQTMQEEFTIPPTPAEVEDIQTTVVDLPAPVLRNEIRELQFKANERVKIAPLPFENVTDPSSIFDVPAEEVTRWERPKTGATPFPEETVSQLYVRNYGEGPAKLEVTLLRRLAFSEVMAIPLFAGGILLTFLLAMTLQGAFPKMAAISLATVKSEIAQPMFPLILGVGIVLLLGFVWVPYNTFGEDIKMLKDTGLGLILILCILQAVWAASSSVSEEIEGRTALTLLSKPVGRRDFILGKFLGIGWTTALLAFVLGITLLIGVAYKPIYDAREGANYEATWQLCFSEMIRTVPGLVLLLMEALVMTAISVAISTRLPTLPNFIICFSIYALGHLTPLLVQSQVVAAQFEPVIFIGRFLATILPVLEYFNIQASIAAGAEVPYAYLAWAFVYCGLYCSVAMLLALVLFEDRDLA
jgi:hypothetical protein